MAEIKIEDVRFEKLGGITLPIVMVGGLVDPLAASYTLQRFQSGKRVNTVRTDQRAIQHLYRFYDERSLNFKEELRKLKPLTAGEIEEYSSSCSVNSVTGELYSSSWYAIRFLGAERYLKFVWMFYQSLEHDPEKLLVSEKHWERMKRGFSLYAKAPDLSPKN